MQQQQNKKNNNMYYSSDESFMQENSFDSSEEELFEQRNNYNNSVYHLKEQMNNFFSQNVDLKDELKLETYDYENDNQIYQLREEKIKQTKKSSDKINQQEQREYIDNVWSNISKQILQGIPQNKNVQPSLETINNKLNSFKQKVQQVDYVEMLAKEIEEEQKYKKVKKDSLYKNKQKKDEKSIQNDDDLQYFSYKQKLQYKQLSDQQAKKKFKDNDNSIDSNDSNNEQNIHKYFDRLFNNQKIKEVNLDQQQENEFQTQIGQFIFKILQQNHENKFQMKKQLALYIRDHYNRIKQQLEKSVQYPPQMPKFKEKHNLHLNMLLPDFTINSQNQNKQDMFKNIDNIKVEFGSVENEYIKMIDKIVEGQIIDYWKETQNHL